MIRAFGAHCHKQTSPGQSVSANQLGDIDIHFAILCDRLNRARKIWIV